jgi:hypothetical protein
LLVIIYSHRDEGFVTHLAARLQERLPGTEVFYDRLMDESASWTSVLATRMRSARALLVVASSNLLASKGAEELAFFHRLKRRGDLVVLELAPGTAPPELGNAVVVDFSNGVEGGLDRLVEVLTIRKRSFLSGVILGALAGAALGGYSAAPNRG